MNWSIEDVRPSPWIFTTSKLNFDPVIYSPGSSKVPAGVAVHRRIWLFPTVSTREKEIFTRKLSGRIRKRILFLANSHAVFFSRINIWRIFFSTNVSKFLSFLFLKKKKKGKKKKKKKNQGSHSFRNREHRRGKFHRFLPYHRWSIRKTSRQKSVQIWFKIYSLIRVRSVTIQAFAFYFFLHTSI